ATVNDVEVSGKVVSVELNGNAPSYKGKWESGQETFMSDEQLRPHMDSAKESPEKKRQRADAPSAPEDLAAWETAMKMAVDIPVGK
ncbi:unnamed protein product, partial [Prorocentrum cordatum]